MRIAAIGDLHVRDDAVGKLKDLFTTVSKSADVLLLCGDLTDEGTEAEATILKTELASCLIPVIAVLGNHDYHHNQQQKIIEILHSEAVTILNGQKTVTIDDVGFAGTKGFGGGFDQYMLPNWGEQILKDMVQEGVNETLKLEASLSKLSVQKKVVLLHYAPIRDTIVGESPEIFPFLGLSRLAGPIDSYKVAMAFHGHAHHGTYQGKTAAGVPVFNVARALLKGRNMTVSYHEI